METIIATFIVTMSLLFIVLFIYQDRKSTKLCEEDGVLKAELRQLKEGKPGCSLTKKGIEDAIRELGSLPERDGDFILFSKDGDRLAIDAERIPLISVQKRYHLDREAWDIDRLRRAAHLLSDKIVMAKALVSPSDEEELSLCFLISALETDSGLSQNLPKYVNILEDAKQRLSIIYNGPDVADEVQTPVQPRGAVLN